MIVSHSMPSASAAQCSTRRLQLGSGIQSSPLARYFPSSRLTPEGKIETISAGTKSKGAKDWFEINMLEYDDLPIAELLGVFGLRISGEHQSHLTSIRSGFHRSGISQAHIFRRRRPDTTRPRGGRIVTTPVTSGSILTFKNARTHAHWHHPFKLSFSAGPSAHLHFSSLGCTIRCTSLHFRVHQFRIITSHVAC